MKNNKNICKFWNEVLDTCKSDKKLSKAVLLSCEFFPDYPFKKSNKLVHVSFLVKEYGIWHTTLHKDLYDIEYLKKRIGSYINIWCFFGKHLTKNTECLYAVVPTVKYKK